MSEVEQVEAGSDQAVLPGHSGNVGAVRGIPGKHIENVGLLDLRGVTAEELAQVESIENVGAVLIDASLRAAMTHIATTNIGTIAEVDPDYRVIVEPWIEFSKATLEAMPQGQKLVLVGIMMFRPDVPPALVAEKFEALQVVGILLAPAGVHGALLGKMQITGVSATIQESDAPVIHSVGQNKVTAGYLSHLEDGSLYINVGQTEIAADVPEELLARKFATYYNVGQTCAPAPLLDLLKARCPTNLGDFSEPGEDDGEAEH